jgi:hypothetical protein
MVPGLLECDPSPVVEFEPVGQIRGFGRRESSEDVDPQQLASVWTFCKGFRERQDRVRPIGVESADADLSGRSLCRRGGPNA